MDMLVLLHHVLLGAVEASPTPDQAAGSVTVNFPPPRGDAPTAMSPDMARSRCWLTASPKPVPFPPDLVVKNGSKMRSRS